MITTNTQSIVQKLLGNLLLVEWLEPPKQSRGGILLPDGCVATIDKVGIQARVLLVGSKFEFSEECHVGAIVLVSKYLGTIIDKTKEHIRIYDAEDILGVVT